MLKSDPKTTLPPGDLFMCADLVYEDAPDSHAKAKLAVVNEEYFAILFPVDEPYKAILKKTEDERDPGQKFILSKYLEAPLNDHVHVPILAIIGESFDEPEIMYNWSVGISYTTSDPAYRAIVLIPQNSQRNNDEYVKPYMRLVKREGQQHIYLEAGHED